MSAHIPSTDLAAALKRAMAAAAEDIRQRLANQSDDVSDMEHVGNVMRARGVLDGLKRALDIVDETVSAFEHYRAGEAEIGDHDRATYYARFGRDDVEGGAS